MVSLIRASNQSAKYDVVHVEHLRGVKYALHLLSERNGTPPVVWDSVDSIALLFRQSSEQSAKRAFRWLTQFELRRTEHMEAQLMNRLGRILVTSQKDRETLLAYPQQAERAAVVTVIPNGVDLEYFRPDANIPREENQIVVSGKMSYHANITMVLYLYEKIMPLIWSRRPQVQLWVVGKDPSPEIQALGEHPSVKVTGTVADIRPYLQRASLAVAPLVYGAGIQNKVLESMACGTPVVANPLAVSAFQAVQDQDLLVGADPQEFAEKVLILLENEDLRQKVGKAGRNYVERCHDWEKIAIQLEEVYHAVH
jgi:glycosyltransferase involved in cell wall biosynthesis